MSARKPKSKQKSTPRVCKQESPKGCKTLDQLVNYFIVNVRDDLESERREYRKVGRATKGKELGELIAYRRTDRKVHGHQCRISREAKQEAATKFTRLRHEFKSFQDLFSDIESKYAGIKGLGPLAVYDAARRYGLMTDKKLVPKSIYLHSGALDGAKALGIPTRGRRSIDMADLPASLQKSLKPLTEDEAEVFLCIYKDELGKFSVKK